MPPDEDDDLKLPADEKEIPNGKEVSDESPEGDGDADAEGSEDQGQDDQADDEGEGQEGLAKSSRGKNEFARLRAERREERARADRLEREIAAIRADRERDRAREAVETPEQEAARLALMSPEERIDYKLAKAEQQNQQFLRQQAFMSADQQDKLAYKEKALDDPRYAKYGAEVEEKLAEARRTGGNPSREVVLKYLLGEKLLASKKSETVKKAAEASVRRQTTSPGSSKGDLGSTGRKANTLAKRLENVQL